MRRFFRYQKLVIGLLTVVSALGLTFGPNLVNQKSLALGLFVMASAPIALIAATAKFVSLAEELEQIRTYLSYFYSDCKNLELYELADLEWSTVHDIQQDDLKIFSEWSTTPQEMLQHVRNRIKGE